MPTFADHDISEDIVHLEGMRGNFDVVERHAARLAPYDLNFIAVAVEGHVEMHLWRGDPHAARVKVATFFHLLDTVPWHQVFELNRAPLGLRAEAGIAVRARARKSDAEFREAREIGLALLTRMRAYAAETEAERPAYAPQVRALLAACEAEWSRLEGASDPARWRRAADAAELLGMPYPKAYALMREGEALLAGRRDRPAMAAALEEAFEIASRLGAKPLRAKVEELAERAHLGLARGSAPTPAPPRRSRESLTRREVEVARLVGAGRSDAQIAAELFISRKTVSVHVTNIRAKLGAQSRRDLVKDAMDRGLVPTPSSPR
jgi:DNA-binding CsgD family transcriptional regulator